jgi:hypothetical protein
MSFRRSCREGVCGSDAMNINGKNGLACLTNMNTLPGTIVLKPLPGLPVIRDLIVDMTQFFKQYNSIKPYLINDNVPPEKERLQSPKSARSSTACTSASCAPAAPPAAPASGGTRTSSSAPAGLLQAYRFIADSRDRPRRAAGQPGRPLPPVPLPHHHELCGRLPQGPEPHQGDRQDQGNDGVANRLMHRNMNECPMNLLDERALSKLRWRCRRGLLENDLFIERFFAIRMNSLTVRQAGPGR